MSWNCWGTVTSPADVEKIIPSNAEELSPEAQEQLSAAHAAASAILDSGVVGIKGKTFSLSISGHANPNHEPTPGWANDCISISLTQMSPQP